MFKKAKRKIDHSSTDNGKQQQQPKKEQQQVPQPIKNFIKLPTSEHDIAMLQGHKKNLERTFSIMNESPNLFEKHEIEDVKRELGRCENLLLQKKHIVQTKQQFYEEVCTVHEKMINERTKAISEIQGDCQSSDFLPAFAEKMMERQNALMDKVEHIKYLILSAEEGADERNINNTTKDGDFAHDPEAS